MRFGIIGLKSKCLFSIYYLSLLTSYLLYIFPYVNAEPIRNLLSYINIPDKYQFLQNTCQTYSYDGMEYTICFYDSVRQNAGGNTYTIGSFTDYTDNSFTLTGGTFCPAIDQYRSGNVNFQCASETSMLIQEPRICFYNFTLRMQEFCNYLPPPPPPVLDETCIKNIYRGSVVNIEGDDNAVSIGLPFTFPFYCLPYTSIGISTNGLLTFGYESSSYANTDIPSSSSPNNMIAVFWTDLITNGKTIYTSFDTNSFTIQWTDMAFYGSSIPLGTFQSRIFQNGTIHLNYISLMGSSSSFGSGATIGIENIDGTKGIKIGYRQEILSSGISYTLTPTLDECNYILSPSAFINELTTLISPTTPSITSILHPLNNTIYSLNQAIEFSWISNATNYKLYISTTPEFRTVVYQNNAISNTIITYIPTESNRYYWKLYACEGNDCIDSCIYTYDVTSYLTSPPSPEPPSPPPPYGLSQAAIQQVTATVSTAIATTVSTTVSTMVASSVASSVGGASSIPPPDPLGLVTMISVVQGMAMKAQLQLGKIPDAFDGLVSSMNWINIDIKLPNFRPGRRLLSITDIASFHEHWIYGSKMFFLYFGVLLPLGWIHHIITQRMALQGKPVQGFLGFPQLHFTIWFMLLTPFSKAAAGLFSLWTVGSIFFGIFLLLLLPIPLILLTIYHNIKWPILENKAQYIVLKEPNKTWFSNIQTFLFSKPLGVWHAPKTIMDMYGIFFKSTRGPPHIRHTKTVVYDTQKKLYHFKEETVSKPRFYGQLLFIPYSHIKTVLITLVLGSFTYHPDGSLTQLFLLASSMAIHIFYMAYFIPGNTPHGIISEFVSSLSELGIYIASCTLLILKRWYPLKETFYEMKIGSIMVTLQMVSVFIHIFFQCWGTLATLYKLKDTIIPILLRQNTNEVYRRKIILQKYANRWFLKTFNKPLSNIDNVQLLESSNIGRVFSKKKG